MINNSFKCRDINWGESPLLKKYLMLMKSKHPPSLVTGYVAFLAYFKLTLTN